MTLTCGGPFVRQQRLQAMRPSVDGDRAHRRRGRRRGNKFRQNRRQAVGKGIRSFRPSGHTLLQDGLEGTGNLRG